MARTRYIKPALYTNEELAECSIAARYLFPALWTLADREGRMEDRPKRIKAAAFPYDDFDVNALLKELADRGFILRYQDDCGAYIQINNFAKHQKPHQKEQVSTIPPPRSLQTTTKVVANHDLGDGMYAPLNGEWGMGNDILDPPPIAPPRGGEPEGFADFWEAYPRQRRGSKDKAKVAYAQALKRAGPGEILRGTIAYAHSHEVAGGYAKGAAAWLNDDRWTNDYDYKPQKGTKNGEYTTEDAVRDALAEHCGGAQGSDNPDGGAMFCDTGHLWQDPPATQNPDGRHGLGLIAIPGGRS
jgi:hypothetical protein